MLEKDLSHLWCLHGGGTFVLKSPCGLLAEAAMVLLHLAEHEHGFALAFWWQIPVLPHHRRDTCHPSRSAVMGELLLSFSSGGDDWAWCMAEDAPCFL